MPSYGQGPGYGSDSGSNRRASGVRGSSDISTTKSRQRGSRQFSPRTRSGGFSLSLIELLIVLLIAIIIFTIVVPQLLRYAERSRITRDETNLSELERAINVLIIDSEIYGLATSASADNSASTIEIRYQRDGLVEVSFKTDKGDEVLARAIADYFGVSATLRIGTGGARSSFRGFALPPFASKKYREYEAVYILAYLTDNGTLRFEREYVAAT